MKILKNMDRRRKDSLRNMVGRVLSMILREFRK